MKKILEYRQYASECRSLAQMLSTEEGRSQLLKIAEAWEALAAGHSRRSGAPAGDAEGPSLLQRATARALSITARS